MKRKTSIFFLLAWNDYRIFQGISRYAREAGWQMDTRHFFLNLFPTDRAFHGMIAMWHRDPKVNAYIRKKAKLVPTVILGTQNPGVDAPMVMPDNAGAGRRAAQHLYDLYHKHYAWFACDLCPSGAERKSAFEARLGELGFSCADLSCGRSAFDAKAVRRKLKQAPKPLGVMARDDHDAAVLIELCQQAGLRTPEEVAVVGVGDLESLCAFSPIAVSSVSLSTDELGYQAAAVLHRRMGGERVPEATVIPCGLLTQRLSTGCLAVTNAHVMAAVRAADSCFSTPLTMDDLAAAAGVSRRQLYNLFRSEMRCSPHEYLLQVRLCRARMLVEAGELRLNEIATACGLNTPRTLNRAFHQRFGQAPSKWAKAGTATATQPRQSSGRRPS
jgi:LacI family transcriptional regulator